MTLASDLEPRLEPRLESRLGPRLGMRYGRDVWALHPEKLFVESTGHLIKAKAKSIGISPLYPSLKAAVEGVFLSYGTSPVMGTDPEFFVSLDGRLVPAFDVLPDKHLTTNGLFWDGFQAETLVDLKSCGRHCLKDCQEHRLTCHSLLAQRVARQLQFLPDMGLQVAPKAVWHVPRDILTFAGEAQVALGCDPSRNVYATKPRRVLSPRKLEWRFAGGHVHFELSPEERSNSDGIRYLVKTLDCLLGIPTVCLAQNYDHFIRRRYYGLAGEYRLPPHGLEYRTLSNFWLMHPLAFMLVFDLARQALNIGRARLKNVFVGATREASIRDTIDYCDVRSAKDFMRLNKAFYSSWTRMMYGSDRAFWEAINGGLEAVVPRWGQDVVRDWDIAKLRWSEVPSWRQLG